MSASYLVYRCKEGEVLKRPEAVICLWPEDLSRFSEILDEAASTRPEKKRQPGEYWEILPKEEADPYDWEKVVSSTPHKEHDPLGDMWKERARVEKLLEEGMDLEQALDIGMTPFAHSFRYESRKKEKETFLPDLRDDK